MHAIHGLYPGSDAWRQWLLADMEKLVEKQSCIGVTMLGNLGDYFQNILFEKAGITAVDVSSPLLIEPYNNLLAFA